MKKTTIEPISLPYVYELQNKEGSVKDITFEKVEENYYQIALEIQAEEAGRYFAFAEFNLYHSIEKRKTVYEMILTHREVRTVKKEKEEADVVGLQDLHVDVYLYLEALANDYQKRNIRGETEDLLVELFTEGGKLERRFTKIKYDILTKTSLHGDAIKQTHVTEVFKIMFNDRYGKQNSEGTLDEKERMLPLTERFKMVEEFAKNFYANEQKAKKPLQILRTFLWDRLEEDEEFRFETMTTEDIISYIKKSKDASKSTIEGIQGKLKQFCTYYGKEELLPDFKGLKRELFQKTVKRPHYQVDHVEELLKELKENYQERIEIREKEWEEAQGMKFPHERKLLKFKNNLMIEKRDYAIFLLISCHGLTSIEVTNLSVDSLKENTLEVTGRLKMTARKEQNGTISEGTYTLNKEIQQLGLNIKNEQNKRIKAELEQTRKEKAKQLSLLEKEIRNKREDIVLKQEVLEAIDDYLNSRNLFEEKQNPKSPLFIQKRDFYDRSNRESTELTDVQKLSEGTIRAAFAYKAVDFVEEKQKNKTIIEVKKIVGKPENRTTVEEVLRYLTYVMVKKSFYDTTPRCSLEEVIHKATEVYDKPDVATYFYRFFLEEEQTDAQRKKGHIKENQRMVIDDRGTKKDRSGFTFKIVTINE